MLLNAFWKATVDVMLLLAGILMLISAEIAL